MVTVQFLLQETLKAEGRKLMCFIPPPESGWDLQRVCGTDGDNRGHQTGQEGTFQYCSLDALRRKDPYSGSPRNSFRTV